MYEYVLDLELPPHEADLTGQTLQLQRLFVGGGFGGDHGHASSEVGGAAPGEGGNPGVVGHDGDDGLDEDGLHALLHQEVADDFRTTGDHDGEHVNQSPLPAIGESLAGSQGRSDVFGDAGESDGAATSLAGVDAGQGVVAAGAIVAGGDLHVRLVADAFGEGDGRVEGFDVDGAEHRQRGGAHFRVAEAVADADVGVAGHDDPAVGELPAPVEAATAAFGGDGGDSLHDGGVVKVLGAVTGGDDGSEGAEAGVGVDEGAEQDSTLLAGPAGRAGFDVGEDHGPGGGGAPQSRAVDAARGRLTAEELGGADGGVGVAELAKSPVRVGHAAVAAGEGAVAAVHVNGLQAGDDGVVELLGGNRGLEGGNGLVKGHEVGGVAVRAGGGEAGLAAGEGGAGGGSGDQRESGSHVQPFELPTRYESVTELYHSGFPTSIANRLNFVGTVLLAFPAAITHGCAVAIYIRSVWTIVVFLWDAATAAKGSDFNIVLALTGIGAESIWDFRVYALTQKHAALDTDGIYLYKFHVLKTAISRAEMRWQTRDSIMSVYRLAPANFTSLTR